jgi:DNA-binding MarR family transcriptional regulator
MKELEMTDIQSWNTMRGGFLGYLLTEARNTVIREIERELAPLGITNAQFRVVVGIAHDRAHTLSEFARFLDMDTGAMKRLLDRVEEKGWIRRKRSAGDRRTLMLELTDDGRAIYPAIMEGVTRVHHRLLEGLSPVEETQLQYFLQKITANANR